jgi:hypothetical protein
MKLLRIPLLTFAILTFAILTFATMLYAQAPAKPAAPVVADKHVAAFFKAQSDYEHAIKVEEAARASMQDAVKAMAADCGAGYQLTPSQDGWPVCAAISVPATKKGPSL